MSSNLIAFNSSLFWLTGIVATILLTPLTDVTARKWTLACINVGFLVSLLSWNVLGVVATVFVAQLILRTGLRHGSKILTVGVLGACAVGLFVLHKGDPTSAPLYLQTTISVLATIGFSYAVLRFAEVVRATAEEQYPVPDLPTLINYILPFHMLAAGPIQSYHDFMKHAGIVKAPDARQILQGAERIALGLFKKFVLALMLQKTLLTDFQSSGIFFFIEVQVFYVWLYLDFSAYSDIAVGVGEIIGVSTPENFNNPLLARNLVDFWERWHISLSLFIRRNLFLPIQMTLLRKSEVPRPLISAVFAIIVSFELCGLWHGASLGWIAWGSLHAFGLAAVRVYGEVLQRVLGQEGVKRYRASRLIRCVSTVVTFEYIAFALLPIFLFRTNLLVW